MDVGCDIGGSSSIGIGVPRIYPKEAWFMNNEGILLLFIRQVEPEIVGRSSGESSTDFDLLSGLEGLCLARVGCPSLVDPPFSTLFPSHSSPCWEYRSNSHDASFFGSG